MLIDKLRNYYGLPDAEHAEYIKKCTRNMSEEMQDKIAQQIIENHSKRFGFPDVAVLSKYISETKKTGYKIYWAVCNACGCEYDYRFTSCPNCYLLGNKDEGHTVKVADKAPETKIIRWNIPILAPVEGMKTCAQCNNRTSGYCWMFGRPDQQCSRSEFEYCACRECCAFHKKANAQIMSGK